MGVNYGAMKKADDELKEGEGGVLLLQKDLKEDSLFRITPNSPGMNGLLYMKIKQYWFGKTPVICASVLGKDDVIQQEIDEAMNGDDAAEINAILSDEQQFKVQETLFYPGFLVNYVLNDKGKIAGIKAIGGGRVLACGKQLATQINEISMTAQMQRLDSEDGIADQKLGFNIATTRKVTGSSNFDVKYGATLMEQFAIPDHIWAQRIDLYEYVKSLVPNPTWQRAKIRELIHGTPIPKEIQDKENARKEKYKELWKQKQEEMKAAAKAGKASKEDDSDELAEEKPKDKPAAATKNKPKDKPKPAAKDEDEDESDGAPFEDESGDDDDTETTTKANKPAGKPKNPPKIETSVDDDDF